MEANDKYNDVFEKAKKSYNKTIENLDRVEDKNSPAAIMYREVMNELEHIFPELKESEDERTRKSLIILLQHFCKGYRVRGLDFPVSFKDMLDWVEKQGKNNKSQEATPSAKTEKKPVKFKIEKGKAYRCIITLSSYGFFEGCDYIAINDGVLKNEYALAINVNLWGYETFFKPVDEDPLLTEDDRIIQAIKQTLVEIKDEKGWNCVHIDDEDYVLYDEIREWLSTLQDRLSR